MKDLPVTMQPDNWMEKTGGYAKDMTLYQYIAVEAMKAMLSNEDAGGISNVHLALTCKGIAHVMLKELND